LKRCVLAKRLDVGFVRPAKKKDLPSNTEVKKMRRAISELY
jgi:hypothetical protein